MDEIKAAYHCGYLVMLIGLFCGFLIMFLLKLLCLFDFIKVPTIFLIGKTYECTAYSSIFTVVAIMWKSEKTR